MALEKELEALRSDLAGCRVAAFVDLDARLVLISSAKEKLRQEWLDALAETGAALLPVGPGPVAAGMPGGQMPDQAVMLRSTGLRVYVRLESDPTEALCCDCDPQADAVAVLDGARAALVRLTAG